MFYFEMKPKKEIIAIVCHFSLASAPHFSFEASSLYGIATTVTESFAGQEEKQKQQQMLKTHAIKPVMNVEKKKQHCTESIPPLKTAKMAEEEMNEYFVISWNGKKYIETKFSLIRVCNKSILINGFCVHWQSNHPVTSVYPYQNDGKQLVIWLLGKAIST